MDQSQNDGSEGEISDDGLKIVIESPKRKSSKKLKSPLKIDSSEKQAIESIEKELEETLEEKATKTNLTTHNVKNILRQVVTNEHVLALVRQTENPETISEIPFQPKLTRAKAKELFSSKTVSSLPWPTKPPSEVQQLINDELAEDSSGDEYVPAEEESEDDSFVHSESELRSISPPTPIQATDSPDKVQWTEDGMFKIPPAKTKEDKDGEEEANIALRTRSKLSLSSTPLEVIEEAFIPPDITTDMYDMDCDDDVWYDFLKKFCRPLDEITKATEDEDHDPEYNILADEEIDEVDTEELRADKAVKVTKKELNALIAELFECANAFSEEKEKSLPKIDLNLEQPHVSVLEDVSLQTINSNDDTQNTTANSTLVNQNLSSIEPASSDVSNVIIIRMDQRLLLEQQIRQHVQLLAQTYLLTFQHPEFHDSSLKSKENLINFKLLSENKIDSIFKAYNLESALKLIENWEKQWQLDTDEIKTMKEHVYRVINECKESYNAGTEYIPTFPTLILETISKSDVFIYPALLPRIPFKPTLVFKKVIFTKSEDELIAIGMEQFTSYLVQDSYHLTYQGEVKLKNICYMIVQYMMPERDITKLYCHVHNSKHPRTPMNPIKYFFQNKRAPTTVHYVTNLKEFAVMPPCKRNKELLPYQWMQYLYPEEDTSTTTSKGPTSFTKVVKPPAYNKNFAIKSHPKRKIASKSSATSLKKSSSGDKHNNKLDISPIHNNRSKSFFCSTPRSVVASTSKKKLENYFNSPKLLGLPQDTNSCIKCMKFNSSIFKKLKDCRPELGSKFNMLPSMPFLDTCNSNKDSEATSLEACTVLINSSDNSQENGNAKTIEADSTIMDGDDEELTEKDNEEEITALMIASSTIKNVGRKGPSRAEKKKEKLRKEYSANLAMLSPEDPVTLQEKNQSYAQAYFDKARERLDSQDYQTLLEILNNFTERNNSISHLYKQVETILGEKHQDLMEEFLTFLTPAQAKDVGKLIPYYMLSNMSLFLRKLEIYFKEQPAQLRKIYRSLTDLSTCMNVTMDHVKNMILPLLKGNTLLTDWFLQIFPCEPPPQSLLKGPWEQIDIRQEATMNDSIIETITVSEVEEPYGGPNCVCLCHQGEDPQYKSRSQHCTPCGIKFLQGRVYIQTGKGLRLANITFNGNSNIDHNARLSCSSADKKKRRSEISPAKQTTSPAKDHQTEVRAGNDSEDEVDCNKRKARACKSPRKKRVKISEKTVICDKNENGQQLENHAAIKTAVTTLSSVSESVSDNIENKMETASDTTDKIVVGESCDVDLNKLVAEETIEWDCNTSIESNGVRHSPEHSAESESEFCEESSQDNINTETDDSAEELESLSNSPVHSENSNSNTSEEISWTRDEDKVILETLQKEGDKEDTFTHIAEILGNRTVVQIKERFNTLMSLLKKMTSFISK